jgi:hypothetical protein
MTINYEITAVHLDNNCMDVTFSKDGKTSQLVGMPIPLSTENLTDVLRSYSPEIAWNLEDADKMSINAGKKGTVDPIVQPSQETTSTAFRNSLLGMSDWTQLKDAPLTDAKKAEWDTYRQSLRDITTHANWPDMGDSDWPTKPE